MKKKKKKYIYIYIYIYIYEINSSTEGSTPKEINEMSLAK